MYSMCHIVTITYTVRKEIFHFVRKHYNFYKEEKKNPLLTQIFFFIFPIYVHLYVHLIFKQTKKHGIDMLICSLKPFKELIL